jgi:two-component system, response regulator YesN
MAAPADMRPRALIEKQPAMPDSCDPATASHHSSHSRLLWVDLTQEAQTALVERLGSEWAMDLQCVKEPTQIPGAIEVYAPQFVCFEFDAPEVPGINALARTRHEHPGLPVLMITGCLSEAVARWALHMRVWDLLVKPVPVQALRQHIAALAELTELAHPHNALPSAARKRQDRTLPAITHVAVQFHHKIALEKVAALCRLSPSQFCRVFRQEQGVSFAQYLLHYRIDRACERLGCPGALAKEVAYSVGFNDLSYFTWAFKRQVGVCPSRYHADPGAPWGPQDCPNG